MCISTQALFLFASLLTPDIVTWTPDQVVIEAEMATVFWDKFDDDWCTVAPIARYTAAISTVEDQIVRSTPF